MNYNNFSPILLLFKKTFSHNIMRDAFINNFGISSYEGTTTPKHEWNMPKICRLSVRSCNFIHDGWRHYKRQIRVSKPASTCNEDMVRWMTANVIWNLSEKAVSTICVGKWTWTWPRYEQSQWMQMQAASTESPGRSKHMLLVCIVSSLATEPDPSHWATLTTCAPSAGSHIISPPACVCVWGGG